jgi:hypothetical protein
MIRLAQRDKAVLMLILVFMVLARPLIAALQTQALSGQSLFVILLFSAASVTFLVYTGWSLWTGRLQPSDWGLSLKYSWGIGLFFVSLALIGLIVTTDPVVGWEDDLPKLGCLFPLDIVLKASLLSLLSRTASGWLHKYRLGLVIIINTLLLYPGLGASDTVFWFFWNIIAVLTLSNLGTILMSVVVIFPLIQSYSTTNGAILVIGVVLVYFVLALLAKLAQVSHNRRLEIARQ